MIGTRDYKNLQYASWVDYTCLVLAFLLTIHPYWWTFRGVLLAFAENRMLLKKSKQEPLMPDEVFNKKIDLNRSLNFWDFYLLILYIFSVFGAFASFSSFFSAEGAGMLIAIILEIGIFGVLIIAAPYAIINFFKTNLRLRLTVNILCTIFFLPLLSLGLYSLGIRNNIVDWLFAVGGVFVFFVYLWYSKTGNHDA